MTEPQDDPLLDFLDAFSAELDKPDNEGIPGIFTALNRSLFNSKGGNQLLEKAAQRYEKTDEVITQSGVIVVFRFRPNIKTDDQKKKVRDALTSILAAKPDAVLEPIQTSLGIEIINIQRPTPPVPPFSEKVLDTPTRRTKSSDTQTAEPDDVIL